METRYVLKLDERALTAIEDALKHDLKTVNKLTGALWLELSATFQTILLECHDARKRYIQSLIENSPSTLQG